MINMSTNIINFLYNVDKNDKVLLKIYFMSYSYFSKLGIAVSKIKQKPTRKKSIYIRF